MKKILLVALIAVFVLSLTGVAYANYAVHAAPEKTAAPFFAPTTSGCAGCHRAHTAVVSKLGFAAGINQPIAESTVPNTSPSAFCLVCHGQSGSLADTDVINGKWSVRKGSGGESAVNSLNGGGFNKINATTTCTSVHKVEGAATTAWGKSTTSDKLSGFANLNCGHCHDPHGSYNYRLLKTDGGDKIESNETNWHSTAYSPDYTRTYYKKNADANQGLSSHCWQAACHAKYEAHANAGNTQQGQYETITWKTEASPPGYDWKNTTRFRHAVNVPLSRYQDLYPLWPNDLTTTLPVEKANRSDLQTDPANWMGCLTCHKAHGTTATMSLEAANIPPGSATWDGTLHDSTLLRQNNRGVCEDCHKK